MTPLPIALCGLWRRGSMTYPDGRIDSTTRVFWLQTQRLYGDIRVPAGQVCRPDARGFEDLSDGELIGLAALQGFAGTLDFDGAICRWHRELDYRPASAPPDEARAEIDGDVLIETGIHANYAEDWFRETAAGSLLAAFRPAGRSARAGILVIAGDYFIEIRDRSAALPTETDLAELIRADLARGERALAEARLDMRICFGKRSADAATILLSTLPWLEGTAPFARDATGFDPATETLTVWNGSDAARWRLIDSSVDGDTLAAWFKP